MVILAEQEIKQLNQYSDKYQEISIEEDLILRHFELPSDETMFAAQFRTATELISHCEQYLNKQRIYHKRFGQLLKKHGFERFQKNGKHGYMVIFRDSE